MEKWQETLKLSIPAFVYVIQNNLGFFALSKLDPATYQVTYQVKLLTTAVVMRVMLGKVLNVTQWMGLFVLLFGVCLVEVEKLSISEQAQSAVDTHAGAKQRELDSSQKAKSAESPNESYFSFNIVSGEFKMMHHEKDLHLTSHLLTTRKEFWHCHIFKLCVNLRTSCDFHQKWIIVLILWMFYF